MNLVLSSEVIKARFESRLRDQVVVGQWLTDDLPPAHALGDWVSAQVPAKQCATVIIIAPYGTPEAAAYPPACVGETVFSCVFYRSYQDVGDWIDALGSFRTGQPGRMLTLAMMKPFYLKWADIIHGALEKVATEGDPAIKLSPVNTTNEELGEQLSRGCALAIYVGHGRSRGWSAYRGFRWKHVAAFRQSAPIGCLLSLSCSALEQDKVHSIPMAIRWVMDGRTCAFLGAVGAVKIRPLERITTLLLEAIDDSALYRIDQVIRRVSLAIAAEGIPELEETLQGFRLIGNPLQPIKATAYALAQGVGRGSRKLETV